MKISGPKKRTRAGAIISRPILYTLQRVRSLDSEQGPLGDLISVTLAKRGKVSGILILLMAVPDSFSSDPSYNSTVLPRNGLFLYFESRFIYM